MIPLKEMLMNRIKHQFALETNQLDISIESLSELDVDRGYSHHVIVLIDDLNALAVKALRYARTITPNVIAFHAEVSEGGANKLRQKWELLNTKIPLIIKLSSDRDVVALLIEYIDSFRPALPPDNIVTVLLPQLVASHGWKRALHKDTSHIINAMLNESNINVLTMPFGLDNIERHYTKNN